MSEEVIYSKKFKEWFGDWEKEPQGSSKVVEGSKDFGTDYIIFNPSQAKSSEGNNGNFDPRSNKFKEDIKSNIKNSDKDQIQKFATLVSDYKYSLYGDPSGLQEKIIKVGSKWRVTDREGKRNLGTYDTKEEAKKRLNQVEAFKHMNEYNKEDFIQDIEEIEQGAVDLYKRDSNPVRKASLEGKVTACEDIKDLAQNLPDTKFVDPKDLFVEKAQVETLGPEESLKYFGVSSPEGYLIKGSIFPNLDKVKDIRNKLAKKYKNIFKITQVSPEDLKRIPLIEYNLKRSFSKLNKLSEEEGANFSGNLSAMAPEHLTRIVDPSGELPVPEGEPLKESIPWTWTSWMGQNWKFLTKDQIDLIESPQFKKWFGDWKKGEGSIIVDDKGYPMVLFHGTPENFDTFDDKSIIFFTDDESTARQFARKDGQGNQGTIKECFLNIRNPYVFDADWNDYDEIPFEDEEINVERLMDILSERGELNSHDGLIITNIRESTLEDYGTDYIPFSSSQIMSAHPTQKSSKEEKDKLQESILDVPKKDYYEGVLDGDKMTPECRKQIIDTVKKWKEQINFDFNIYKILAKGSLLTKRYNDSTDLDVSIYTDMTPDQLEEIFDVIPKGKNILVGGQETSHPLDFYVLTKGESTPEENMDCIYDVVKNKWIKKDDGYENDIPLSYLIQAANFFVNGCVVALSNYNSDKVLYEYYNNLDEKDTEIDPEERTSKISSQKDKLLADLDGMRVALRMISTFRQEAYKEEGGEESRPFYMSIQKDISNPHVTFNEQMAKILEKFGIRGKLRDSVKECEDLLGLKETKGLQESYSNPSGDTVAFCFGRFGLPQYGYILLWKFLSQVDADDHLIYTSHSHDKKKNPVSYSTKSSVIKYLLDEYNIDAEFVDSEVRTIIEVAVDLYNKGYKNIIFIGGQDRVKDVTELLQRYNGVPNKKGESYNFDSIRGMSAGDRDPDSDDVSGMSGTKMRQYIKDGDFESFRKSCPIRDKNILQEIYDEAKSFMES